ncbi:Myopalladin [Camelus dromedarius]|uniref:Myopalladin n=1 Tax=Camelus dromedarius TaxID=9838 RepID=A0A5N4EBY9_CAMDR|nr:Myopalladin [Camelus dromedarius]
MQSPCSSLSGSTCIVAPVFTKHLQDISTTRGQFVVFECRVQATATVQVHWYREKEQIADSDDFRILRKSTVIRFSIYFSLRVTPKSNS